MESGLPGIVVGSQVIRLIAAPSGTAIARNIIRLCNPASRPLALRPMVMNSANISPAEIWRSRIFSTSGTTGASALRTSGGPKVAPPQTW